MENVRTQHAVELMLSFARRTGLSSDAPPRRYLWTDAFAVCNLFGLSRKTGDARLHALALQLVDQVHHELGQHRRDSGRRGWLSGLEGAEAEAHPTRGGLRIGKPLPERGPREPYDPDLEWERDGQYFHYLTKWMHALHQAARRTGESRFDTWARELAEVSHRAFTYGRPGEKRMIWKASIDLTRPLVPSMGHHDPLDGFVTCKELGGSRLAAATRDFETMLDPEGLATSDSLGLGGLLVDACRLVQLETNAELVASLLAAAVTGMRDFVAQPDLRAPAHRRLAFRELGLAIGLAGLPMLEHEPFASRLDAAAEASLRELDQYEPLRTEIEAFWLLPYHRETSTWTGHADINDVMLATSLEPEGFLSLRSPSPPAPSDRRHAADDTR